MIKIAFNLSIRPKIRFNLITLMMFLSSFFLFAGFNIINVSYINEHIYLLIRHQTISNLFLLIALLLYFIDFTVIHSLKFENKLFYTILDITSKRWKKVVLYNLTKLFPVILGSLMGSLASFGMLYLVGYIEGGDPGFIFKIPNIIFPLVFPLIYSIITQTSFYLYVALHLKKRFNAFPYILSLLACVFFIFALKSDVMAILFYVSFIILMFYIVVKISDYIRSGSKARYMDSNYGRLLFKTLLDKSLVPLFFITFVVSLMFQANLGFRHSKLSEQRNYFSYDTELKVEVNDTNKDILRNEDAIVYTYISDPIKAVYNNKELVLYILDTSMIKDIANVSVKYDTDEDDTIILTLDYQKRYNMNIGETYAFTINDKVYKLKIKDFIDSPNTFIAYASNITGLEVETNNVLVKTIENNYDINALLEKLEGDNYVVQKGEKESYISLETSRYHYLVIIFVVNLIIFIFWYAKNRIIYYNKKKEVLNGLLQVPVRSFTIKRMIFLNNLEIFTIALIIFFTFHLLLIMFYHPTSEVIYYTFFKELKIPSLLIFILEIVV
ncbi:MAG: hypothetical protein K6F59_03460, partial [Gammaproteobacteria bacterium]|nr:hypothetical protein [Gammaproteobacteria bacterium]